MKRNAADGLFTKPSRLVLSVNKRRKTPHADPQILALFSAGEEDVLIFADAAQEANLFIVFFSHMSLQGVFPNKRRSFLVYGGDLNRKSAFPTVT